MDDPGFVNDDHAAISVHETVLGKGMFYKALLRSCSTFDQTSIALDLHFTDKLQNSLAYVEMRLVLAPMLWEFDLELCEGLEESE